MAPKGRKVWNEDLVRAFRARRQKALREGKNDLAWKEGADIIEAKRGDIWIAASSGKVMNKPLMKRQCQQKLFDDILSGRAPILPEDHLPTSQKEKLEMGFLSTQNENSFNPFANSTLLKRMTLRGGSYAILMAFHNSPCKVLTKDQICQLAQPFCDEEMKENFHAGKLYSGISSLRTLQKHSFVVNTTGRTRAGAEATYTLSLDGEKFIQAMLTKFPPPKPHTHDEEQQQFIKVTQEEDDDNDDDYSSENETTDVQINHRCTAKRENPTPFADNTRHDQNKNNGAIPPPKRKYKDQTHCRKTRVVSHRIEARKSLFPDSNHIDEPCLADTEEITKSVSARRKLFDENAVPLKTAARARTVLFLDSDSSSEDDDEIFPPSGLISKESKPKTKPAGIELSIKKIKTPPAKKSGMKPIRQTTLAESTAGGVTDTSINKVEIINLVDTSDDDDDSVGVESSQEVVCLDEPPPKFVRKPINNPYKAGSKRVRRDHSATLFQIKYLIDNRERIRNSTPRYLRMQLTRLLESGCLKTIWTACTTNNTPAPLIEEVPLKYGDFGFINTSNSKRMDVCIERKRIGDLVQRSVKGDHWRQLNGMRDKFRFAILLIEVNISRAQDFVAYGAGDEEKQRNPLDTTIEDEGGVYLLMGRALLACRGIRFIQTREEQGSLRAVGAVGMVASALGLEGNRQDNVDSQQKEEKQLTQQLSDGSIPLSLAKHVAKEFGSAKRLSHWYAQCTNKDCKLALLERFIGHIMSIEEEQGSALGWSSAIYQIMQASEERKSSLRDIFQQNLGKCEDRGTLLSNLYEGHSLCDAIQSSNGKDDDENNKKERKVLIELPESSMKLFPDESTSSFFRTIIKEHEKDKMGFPTIVMKTVGDGRVSGKLVIHLVPGSEVVDILVQNMHSKSVDPLSLASNAATEIMTKVKSAFAIHPERDRRVVLISGIRPALDAAARQAGCSPLMKPLVDLLFAYLMLGHDAIILQGERKSGDEEKILQQLALSCYLYQMLIKPSN